MRPIFADTFYYLALTSRNDAFHGRAVSLAQNLRVPVLTTAWVITELADALAGTHRRGAFLLLLEGIRNDPDVTVLEPEASLYEEGLALYAQRPDKDWSLTDCISFVAMHRWGLAAALTADQHFQQAGYRALLLEDGGEI